MRARFHGPVAPAWLGWISPKGVEAHPLFAPYWVSDERIRGHVELAAEIAQAFSKTGVWPLLWFYDEDPEAYMQQPGDVELIDAARCWKPCCGGGGNT